MKQIHAQGHSTEETVALEQRVAELEKQVADQRLVIERFEKRDEQHMEDALRQTQERLEERMRKRTEELEKSERMFRALTESLNAGVLINNLENEQCIYANPAAIESTGYTFEELTGDAPPEVLTPESKRLKDEIAEAYLRGEEIPKLLEQEIATKSGELRTIETSWAVIDLEDDGRYRMVTCFDITDRKRAERSLLESQERYRAIFNTAGTAMVIFGDDKVISLANDEWVKLSQYSKEETEGKLTWTPFFTEESLSKMLRYHEQRTGGDASAPNAYEVQFINRSGQIHTGLLNVNLVPGTSQRVASFQDMTDLKRVEQQMYRADKMAALGQIIAGVAHEINNPNNFIYFNLPILRKYIEAVRPMLEHHLVDDPDLTILNMPYQAFLDDVFKLLENMEHGSKRITSIVAELKNYVRSDDAKSYKEESIEKVIDHLMILIGKQVRKMVKRLEVTVAPDLPPLKIDAGKIEQVLINLVINAGQAADKDDAFVKIDCRLAKDNHRYVEISIEDNGQGIPQNIQEQIFEPFFTTKSREAGTGLGLSISHRIIEEHGGTITVESDEGRGTCFTIRLPISEDE